MKKGLTALLTAMLAMFLLTSCGNGNAEGIMDDGGYYIYCLDKEETGIRAVPYEPSRSAGASMAEELLDAMYTIPESEGLVSAVPDYISVKSIRVQGSRVDIDYNILYTKMDAVRESLARAAVVMTLTQVPGIDFVSITVDNEPVTDCNGYQIGAQSSEFYVDNSSSELKKYDKQNISLYYSSETGIELVKTDIEVQYDTNVPLEKVAVEHLMDPPADPGLKSVIPADTRLLSATVQDGVCYVNFDEGFLEIQPGISDEVAIYSVVNTILDVSKAGSVQFQINGDSDIKYHNNIDLWNPFERNLDIVVKEDK